MCRETVVKFIVMTTLVTRESCSGGRRLTCFVVAGRVVVCQWRLTIPTFCTRAPSSSKRQNSYECTPGCHVNDVSVGSAIDVVPRPVDPWRSILNAAKTCVFVKKSERMGVICSLVHVNGAAHRLPSARAEISCLCQELQSSRIREHDGGQKSGVPWSSVEKDVRVHTRKYNNQHDSLDQNRTVQERARVSSSATQRNS